MSGQSPLKLKPLRLPGQTIDDDIVRLREGALLDQLFAAGCVLLLASLEWTKTKTLNSGTGTAAVATMLLSSSRGGVDVLVPRAQPQLGHAVNRGQSKGDALGFRAGDSRNTASSRLRISTAPSRSASSNNLAKLSRASKYV